MEAIMAWILAGILVCGPSVLAICLVAYAYMWVRDAHIKEQMRIRKEQEALINKERG